MQARVGCRMHARARAAVLLGLMTLGACGSFRASAGLCLGLGGSVHAGPADVGVLGGVSYEFGNAYGAIGSQVTVDIGLAVARLELLADGSTRKTPQQHKPPYRARREGVVIDA